MPVHHHLLLQKEVVFDDIWVVLGMHHLVPVHLGGFRYAPPCTGTFGWF